MAKLIVAAKINMRENWRKYNDLWRGEGVSIEKHLTYYCPAHLSLRTLCLPLPLLHCHLLHTHASANNGVASARRGVRS